MRAVRIANVCSISYSLQYNTRPSTAKRASHRMTLTVNGSPAARPGIVRSSDAPNQASVVSSPPPRVNQLASAYCLTCYL